MGQPLPPGTVDSSNTTLATGTNTSPPVNIYTQQPAGQYFTAEQLEAARQQEKDKLYPQLESLKDQLNTFKAEVDTYRQEREAAQEAAKKAAEEAAEAQRKADEEKLSIKELLEKRDQEWQKRQAEMENKFEVERTIMQKDRELAQLQSFIQRRVSEEIAANTIIPDLVDFVDGNTPDEVEASITRLKEKTASIVEGKQRMLSGQTPTPGVSPTGFAPTGPLDNLSGTQELTPQQIRDMSPAEYAKFRAQVGIDKAGNNRGLFN